MDARKSRQVADALLDELVERLETREHLSLYQVGSSTSEGLWAFNDVDVLLVDHSTQERPFERALSLLRASIEKGIPHVGAFVSTDTTTQSVIVGAVDKVQAGLQGMALRAEFSFGPLKVEPLSNEVVLHVCGPLGVLDLEALARHLPFHALGFLAKNRALIGPPLASTLPRPEISRSDLLHWLDAMLRIEDSSAPLEYKLKARRRSALCYLLYRADASAYERVDLILRQLGETNPVSSGDLLRRYEEIYQHL